MFDLYAASQIGMSIITLFGGDGTYPGFIHNGGVIVELPILPPSALWVIRSDRDIHVRQLAELNSTQIDPDPAEVALPQWVDYLGVYTTDTTWTYLNPNNTTNTVVAKGLLAGPGTLPTYYNIAQRGEFVDGQGFASGFPLGVVAQNQIHGLKLKADVYWPIRVEGRRNNAIWLCGTQICPGSGVGFLTQTLDAVHITCVSHRSAYSDIILAPKSFTINAGRGDEYTGGVQVWRPNLGIAPQFTYILQSPGREQDPPGLPF